MLVSGGWRAAYSEYSPKESHTRVLNPMPLKPHLICVFPIVFAVFLVHPWDVFAMFLKRSVLGGVGTGIELFERDYLLINHCICALWGRFLS